MERYVILIDQQAGKWSYKPLNQTIAIARKTKGFQLFNHLKSAGRIRYHKDILINNIWTRTVNNSKI